MRVNIVEGSVFIRAHTFMHDENTYSCANFVMSTCYSQSKGLEDDSWMPKMLQSIEIDSNSDRNEKKTVIHAATETIGNGDERKCT